MPSLKSSTPVKPNKKYVELVVTQTVQVPVENFTWYEYNDGDYNEVEHVATNAEEALQYLSNGASENGMNALDWCFELDLLHPVSDWTIEINELNPCKIPTQPVVAKKATAKKVAKKVSKAVKKSGI